MQVNRSEGETLWERYLPPLWPPIWPPLWPPVWRPLPLEASREANWHTHRLPRAVETRDADSDAVELSGSENPMPRATAEYFGEYPAELARGAKEELDTTLDRYSSAVQWEWEQWQAAMRQERKP